MREQITFAVDANGFSHYVGVSDTLKFRLSINDEGANIDDWPGDFPGELEPGFYAATLEVSGDRENPTIHWSAIKKLTVLAANTKISHLPEVREKERVPRQRRENKLLEPQIRVRRQGEVLV